MVENTKLTNYMLITKKIAYASNGVWFREQGVGDIWKITQLKESLRSIKHMRRRIISFDYLMSQIEEIPKALKIKINKK